MIIKGVEFTGVSKQFPKNLKYFNQNFIEDTLFIESNKPDVRELVSVSVNILGKILKITDTPIRTSSEGKKLLGKKLLVQMELNYKIKYLSNNTSQKFVYILSKKVIKSSYVILSNDINGKSVEDIHRRGGIVLNPYVEDVYASVKNNRSILANVCFLVSVDIKN